MEQVQQQEAGHHIQPGMLHGMPLEQVPSYVPPLSPRSAVCHQVLLGLEQVSRSQGNPAEQMPSYLPPTSPRHSYHMQMARAQGHACEQMPSYVPPASPRPSYHMQTARAQGNACEQMPSYVPPVSPRPSYPTHAATAQFNTVDQKPSYVPPCSNNVLEQRPSYVPPGPVHIHIGTAVEQMPSYVPPPGSPRPTQIVAQVVEQMPSYVPPDIWSAPQSSPRSGQLAQSGRSQGNLIEQMPSYVPPGSPALGPRRLPGSPRVEFRCCQSSPRPGPRRTSPLRQKPAPQNTGCTTPGSTGIRSHMRENIPPKPCSAHDGYASMPNSQRFSSPLQPRSGGKHSSVFCFPDTPQIKPSALASPENTHSSTPTLAGVNLPEPPRDPLAVLAGRGQSPRRGPPRDPLSVLAGRGQSPIHARNMAPSHSPLPSRDCKLPNSASRLSQSPIRSRGIKFVPGSSPCPSREFRSFAGVPGHSPPSRPMISTPGQTPTPLSKSPAPTRDRRSFVAVPGQPLAPTRDNKHRGDALALSRDSRSVPSLAPARSLAWDFGCTEAPPMSGSLRSQDVQCSPSTRRQFGSMSEAAGTQSSFGSLPQAPAQQSAANDAQVGLSMEDLIFTGQCFDPTCPSVKAELISKMNVDSSSNIELLRKQGGQNEGLWALRTPTETLIMKLVSSQRQHPCLPTEAEQYMKLAREHPSIIQDRALAFPVKIFSCRRQGSDTNSSDSRKDLVIMREAPGELFSDVICRKWQAGQIAELMSHFDAVGRFIAEVHSRHRMQHGDCTPSNIFFDEATNTFTMVDISDFGPQSWRSCETDVDRFLRGIELMASRQGAQLYTDGRHHFESGYNTQLLT